MERLSLNEMLQALYPKLEAKKEEITPSVTEFFNDDPTYIIFLSATDGRQRAKVVTGNAKTFAASWEQAVSELRKSLLLSRMSPVWLKADLVTTVETVPINRFMTDLANTRKNYFKQGIAFDRLFKNAFLQQEVNANVFLHNWEQGHVELALPNVNLYMKEGRNATSLINFSQLREVHVFNTTSVFHDGAHIHEQYDSVLKHGNRIVESENSNTVIARVQGAINYLMEHLNDQGKFRNIIFPAFNKSVPAYNIVHHASTVFAMVQAYEILQSNSLKAAIKRALDYIVNEALIEETVKGQECAFVIEKDRDNEVKLGANAFTLLAMIAYTKVTKDSTYEVLLEKLANGILRFQKADGSFVHVLHTDGTVKEKSRTVYFEGEAILALMTFYEMTNNRRLLFTVERSLRYFIRNNYYKHSDPWLNQALTLFFNYRPKKEYAELNIRTAQRRLTNAFMNETASATLLDLLIASHELTVAMKDSEHHLELDNEMDEDELQDAIHYRANLQLDHCFWPEKAMYYAKPNDIVNSFYVREDSYRIQIDEIANHITGYCAYYKLLKNERIKEKNEERMQEAEMLTLAKHYEKQGRFDNANDCYDRYSSTRANWMDITYVAFGDSLRQNGQVNKAKEVLAEGNEKYPDAESILISFLNLFMYMNDYQSALVVAGDLVKIKPKESKYYFELGRAYGEINDFDKAMAAYKIGLIYHHNMATEEVIEQVKAGMDLEAKQLTSTYTFLGGKNNLGVIVHDEGEVANKYITKITRTDSQAKRERTFYRDVLAEYDSLQNVVPAFSGVEVLDGVQYLTIEMIDLVEKTIPIEQIIETSEKITEIAYEDIVENYPNPSYEFAIKNNMGSPLVEFFTQIHKQSQNYHLFMVLRTYAEENKLIENLAPVISRMEAVILQHELYQYIEPEKHYSLLHGDFSLSNMSVRDDNDELVVLDWGLFTIGPHFIDMAYLLTNLPISFEGIKSTYIYNEDAKRKLSLIEKIFFLYALILFYVIKMDEDNVNYLTAVFVVPAVEAMEAYAEEFMKENR